MAGRIRFALEMKDGEKVRDIEALREHFDMESVMGYFLDGKLAIWLNNQSCDNEARQVEALQETDRDLQQKLCKILKVNFQGTMKSDSIDTIKKRNERIVQLKQHTSNPDIIEKIDSVAFDQEDLADLLHTGVKEIYLCGNQFIIPLVDMHRKYIGVGKNVEAVIPSNLVFDFDAMDIQFENIHFDKKYEDILKSRFDKVGITSESVALDKEQERLIKDTPEELVKRGEQLEKSTEYKKAMELYQKAMDSGYAPAMIKLGDLFTFGRGVEKNFEKAMLYYQKAVEIGKSPDGMMRIGVLYLRGDGVAKDTKLAANWFREAANAGNIIAMNNLANMYYKGHGVVQSHKDAIHWYRKAAESGDVKAMDKLASMYYNGDGVDQDYGEAFKWYEKGAKAGNSHSMYLLARMYEVGWYTEENRNQAIYWYQKAADAGYEDAITYLQVLSET